MTLHFSQPRRPPGVLTSITCIKVLSNQTSPARIIHIQRAVTLVYHREDLFLNIGPHRNSTSSRYATYELQVPPHIERSIQKEYGPPPPASYLSTIESQARPAKPRVGMDAPRGVAKPSSWGSDALGFERQNRFNPADSQVPKRGSVTPSLDPWDDYTMSDARLLLQNPMNTYISSTESRSPRARPHRFYGW